MQFQLKTLKPQNKAIILYHKFILEQSCNSRYLFTWLVRGQVEKCVDSSNFSTMDRGEIVKGTRLFSSSSHLIQSCIVNVCVLVCTSKFDFSVRVFF